MKEAHCHCSSKCLEYCVWTIPFLHTFPSRTIKTIKLRNKAICWLHLIMMGTSGSVGQEGRLISENWKTANKDFYFFSAGSMPRVKNKCKNFTCEHSHVKTCKNSTLYMWDGKTVHLFGCVPKMRPPSLNNHSVFNGSVSCQSCMCTFENTFQNIFSEDYFLIDCQCMVRLHFNSSRHVFWVTLIPSKLNGFIKF